MITIEINYRSCKQHYCGRSENLLWLKLQKTHALNFKLWLGYKIKAILLYSGGLISSRKKFGSEIVELILHAAVADRNQEWGIK